MSSNIKLVNIALHHWELYPHYQSVALPSSHLTYNFLSLLSASIYAQPIVLLTFHTFLTR
jgi:hypothetical protein